MKAEYSIRKAKRQGKKDGRNWKWKFWPFVKEPKPVVPEDNHPTICPYEKEIKEGVERDISVVCEEWENKDRGLKENYCVALREYEEAEKMLEKETREANEARARFLEASTKLRMMGRPNLSHGWMLFWLIFLGLCEFPLNGLVFSLFGVGKIETYIIAAALCAIIPWLAHMVGVRLKQAEKTKTDMITIVSILLVVLLLFIAIAIMRADYLAESLKEYGGGLKPSTAAMLFIIINMGIFSGAVGISYNGSHPHEDDYKNALYEYKAALKNLTKEAREAKQAARYFDIKLRQLNRAETYRKQTFMKLKMLAETKARTYEWMAQAYRTENARERGKTIKCFNMKILSVDMPNTFDHLDWSCPDTANLSERKPN